MSVMRRGWLLACLTISGQLLVAEAIQDTLVTVWKELGGYRGDGEVGAWLWGTAIRKLIDRLRRERIPYLDPPR